MKKELRISTFSLPWFFWVAVAAGLLYGLKLTGRGMTDDQQFSLIHYFSIIEFVYLVCYKLSLRYIRPDYNFFNELPCYLCNLSTILAILAALSRSSVLMAYCTSMGFLGALLAYLMPDGPNRNQRFFSWQALGFYGYHSLLIASSLSFYALGLYVPVYGDVWKVIVLTIVMMMAVHLINLLMIKTGLNPKSNFIFTVRPDNAILAWFYKLNPVQLWYLLPVAVPLYGLCALEFFLLRLFIK